MRLPSWHWINRRTALGLLIAGAGAAMLGGLWRATRGVKIYRPTASGYGPDPDLIAARVTWPLTLSPRHRQIADRLADLILPATATAPAPSAVAISRFIDEWVSSPYPEQQADASRIKAGLASLDSIAAQRWASGFIELPEARQLELLTAISTQGAAEYDFFHRFRRLVVAAYYTTQPGLDDIGYRGNVALAAYPAMTAEETSILDAELRKLGL